MNLNEFFVRVGADTTGLQRGMREAGNSVRAFESQAARSGANLDRLRGPLTTLANQVTGLPPAFNQLASVLLSMAAGGGVTAGAIAGFTAVAAVMRSLKEDVTEANKALDQTLKRLDEAAEKRAVGGQLQAFKDLVETRSELRELEDQAAPLRASVATKERLGPLGNLFGSLDKEKAELQKLEAQIARVERGTREASKAMEGAVPAIDGITVSVKKLKTLADFGGVGLNAFAEQATAARQAAGRDDRPEWVKRALALNLRPIEPKGAGQGGGPLDNAVSKFRSAVDSFGAGVKGIVKGAFSTEGLKTIGANLASQGIGFLASKLISGIGGAFDSSTRRLEQAIQQNTNALRASSDFLRKQLSSSGLTDQAAKISTAIQNALDRVRTGHGVTAFGLQATGKTLAEELAKVGISFEVLKKVAQELGIDIDVITKDTLQAFLDQLKNAGAGVEDFTSAIDAATRNVPEIWNAALGRFRATRSFAGNLVAAGGGASFTFTGDLVLPGVRSGADFFNQIETEAQRRTARGGAPIIVDATKRRRV